MLDGFTPSNYMLTARYKIFDKKFKLSFGTEFPGGYRVLKNEEYKSRNVHEIRASYNVNLKTKFSFLYMHGKGRNFSMSNNFYAFYFQKKNKKIYIYLTNIFTTHKFIKWINGGSGSKSFYQTKRYDNTELIF